MVKVKLDYYNTWKFMRSIFQKVNRIIAMGNYGAKSDKLLKTLMKTVDKTQSLPTEKINQLSSVMDQMSKIIDDILK